MVTCKSSLPRYDLAGVLTYSPSGRYNDGLDKWRLTATEVRDEFAKKGADVVYAFQTRNPTHAGHAYLMRTAGDKLREQVGCGRRYEPSWDLIPFTFSIV